MVKAPSDNLSVFLDTDGLAHNHFIEKYLFVFHTLTTDIWIKMILTTFLLIRLHKCLCCL